MQCLESRVLLAAAAVELSGLDDTTELRLDDMAEPASPALIVVNNDQLDTHQLDTHQHDLADPPKPQVHCTLAGTEQTEQLETEQFSGSAAIPVYVDGVFTDGNVADLFPYGRDNTFKLASNPSATKTIYLDFDGHHSVGNWWSHNIVFPAFDRDGNPNSFSDSELSEIQKQFIEVVEDFLPFDVNVTTTDPGVGALTKSGSSDTTWGVRAVNTQYTDGFGDGSGGIAHLDSFSASVDNPVFTFNKGLTAGGMTNSHEIGHSLNLLHDGLGGATYHPGASFGATGWGPVMGAPFGQNLVQWSNGDYADSTTTQDDLAVITNSTNGFGYRTDDHGDSISAATNLNVTNGTEISAWGIIERTDDFDYFSFDTGPGNVSLQINPVASRANLDVEAVLYDSGGNLVSTSNPEDLINASFDLNLATGTYFIRIDGTGKTGVYSDYGSLGYFEIKGTIQPTTAPEITVRGLNSNNINDNDSSPSSTDGTDFGTITDGSSTVTRTFTVTNDGAATLTLGTPTLPGGFTLVSGLSSSLAAGQSDTFSVQLDNTAAGTKSGQISFSNNDGDENPFNFSITGTVNVLHVLPTIDPIFDSFLMENSGEQTVNLTGITDGDNSNQPLAVTATTTNPTLIPTIAVDYSSPDTTGTLRFTPSADRSGSAVIYVTVEDGGDDNNLATDGDNLSRTLAFSVTVETSSTFAEYEVRHNPRLQLGDAPLDGYVGSDDDQIEILWQTVPTGMQGNDSFNVSYRLAGAPSWISAGPITTLDTGVEGRVIHSVEIDGLNFDTDYEYRVEHRRGDAVLLDSYQETFHTRLPAGDDTSYTFVAYGDSAGLSTIDNFRDVQNRINVLDAAPEVDVAFSLLLGDNVYDVGSHPESDARFDPTINPEAAAWIAGHVDYVGFGNHDAGTSNGRPSEQNFSSPIPVAGVTAPAQPLGETPQHNYSFDYGDVHFLTFDTNSLNEASRLDAQLDWVESDLAASTATWNLVFAHHPVAGVPDKNEDPSDNYYQQVVPRLRAAGADMFMVGHSHTYSWTYPLLGQTAGVADFVLDTDKDYAKGAGLIQLVSGAGGRSLRPGDYNQFPFVASGFTTQTTPVVEDGFARIDVTPTQLTVSYLAADDGAVIDSFVITNDSTEPPSNGVVDAQVSQSSDDAEERISDGGVDLTSSDIELGDDPGNNEDQTVGLRFQNLIIPQGSTITAAYLEFETDETDTTATDVTIRAQDSDSATTFTSATNNITDRPMTTASVDWSIPAWNTVNEKHQSTDLSSVVQEVVDRGGWSVGNSMAFIINGTGSRTAESNDGESANAPKLHVEYTTASVNNPPVAVNDSATTNEDTAVIVSVLTNDSDPDGDSLTVTTANASNGTVTINVNGTLNYTPNAGYSGPDTITYSISDGNGGTDTATVNVTVNQPPSNGVVDAQVSQSSDDAEERISDGGVDLTSSDIELGDDPGNNEDQTVGLRFQNLIIPQGSTITAAYLEFETDETDTTATDVTIRAQDSDSATTFTSATNNITDRPMTTASVDWSIPAWNTVNEKHQSTDLSSVVQEVVDRGGWSVGNSMAFIINGTGSRTAESNDGESANAPKLHVEYTTASVNNPPVAVNDSATTNEDTAVIVSVLTNDSDPDGDSLTVTTANASNGTVTINVNGTLNYTPNAGYSGPDTITYSISDGNGGTDSAEVSITVNAVNNDPIANNDGPFATNEDTALNNINVLTNDSDPDGDSLTVTTANASNGTVTINVNGTLNYASDGNYNGEDTITYSISDGNGGTDTASVSITVNPVNDDPVATNDGPLSTDEDTSLNNINVLGNDSDVDGDALSVTSASAVNGNVTINGDGTLNYTPNAGYSGPDTITYSISDGNGGTDTATVNVTVNPVVTADPKVASGVLDGVGTAGWTTVTLVQTYDSMLVVATPVHIAGNPPLVTRIRNASGNSFDIMVQRADGSTADVSNIEVQYVVVEEGQYSVAQHGINMEAVKYTSTITDQNNSWVGEQRAYLNSYTAPVVLGQVMTWDDPNFSTFWSRGSSRANRPDATTLYVGKHVAEDPNATRANETVGYIVIETGTGTLGELSYSAAVGPDSVEGTGNGTDTYAVAGITNASSAVLSQTAMDGSNGGWAVFASATPVSGSTITLAIEEDQLRDSERNHITEEVAYIAFESLVSNNDPIANNDGPLSTDEDTSLNNINVLGNDSDVDGDALSVTSASAVNGNVTINGDGTLNYTPNAGYSGPDTITYSISDGNGGTDSAEVSITVNAVNNDPIANNDGPLSTDEDTSLNNINVLGNDSDVDGDALSVTSASAVNGNVTINGDGTLNYTPNAGYSGPDTITYSISDGNGGTDSAEVSITVNAVNNDPIANNDGPFATNEDTALNNINVLTNDSDPDGDSLTVTTANASNGTVTINVNGTLNYTPNAGYSGPDTITYSISDGNGGTDSAEVSITVNAVNNDPIANNDGPFATNEDTALNNINVLTNDSDPDGDSLTVTTANASNGTVTINVNGTLNYTPNAGYSGPDTITYSISDGNGGTDSAEVSITVNAVNNDPIANNDGPFATNEDTALNNINVLTNDSDPDGDSLTVTTANASNGTVTINVNGTLNYTPNAGYSGPDTITYSISDGNGGTDSAEVSITVNAVNNDPIANNDGPFATNEDTALNNINVLTNDSDPDGDSLTVTTANASNGTVTINVNGTLNYTPNAGYSGPDTITYSISDGNGGTDSAEVSITVNAVNNDPIANNDGPLSTDEDTSLNNINVLGNDSDVDGDALSVTSASAVNGNVTINGDGTLNYTPNAGYSGPDTITYSISDGNGGTDIAAVSINVNSGDVEDTDLVAHWTMDGNAADTSPYGQNNTGSTVGNASFVSDPDRGQVLTLDGTTDYIDVSDSSDINLGIHGQRTVSLWFKADEVSSRQVLFEEGGSIRGLVIYIENALIYIGGWNRTSSQSGWTGTWFSSAVAAGEWHHVALTLDGGAAVQPDALKGYLDGQLFGSGAGSQLWQHSGDIGIGRNDGTTRYHDGNSSTQRAFAGLIDDVRIYNRTLVGSEISTLAGGTSAIIVSGNSLESRSERLDSNIVQHALRQRWLAAIDRVMADRDSFSWF